MCPDDDADNKPARRFGTQPVIPGSVSQPTTQGPAVAKQTSPTPIPQQSQATQAPQAAPRADRFKSAPAPLGTQSSLKGGTGPAPIGSVNAPVNPAPKPQPVPISTPSANAGSTVSCSTPVQTPVAPPQKPVPVPVTHPAHPAAPVSRTMPKLSNELKAAIAVALVMLFALPGLFRLVHHDTLPPPPPPPDPRIKEEIVAVTNKLQKNDEWLRHKTSSDTEITTNDCQRIISDLSSTNIRECPDNFKSAFRAYMNAWNILEESIDRLDNLNKATYSLKTGIEVLVSGPFAGQKVADLIAQQKEAEAAVTDARSHITTAENQVLQAAPL